MAIQSVGGEYGYAMFLVSTNGESGWNIASKCHWHAVAMVMLLNPNGLANVCLSVCQ